MEILVKIVTEEGSYSRVMEAEVKQNSFGQPHVVPVNKIPGLLGYFFDGDYAYVNGVKLRVLSRAESPEVYKKLGQ